LKKATSGNPDSTYERWIFIHLMRQLFFNFDSLHLNEFTPNLFHILPKSKSKIFYLVRKNWAQKVFLKCQEPRGTFFHCYCYSSRETSLNTDSIFYLRPIFGSSLKGVKIIIKTRIVCLFLPKYLNRFFVYLLNSRKCFCFCILRPKCSDNFLIRSKGVLKFQWQKEAQGCRTSQFWCILVYYIKNLAPLLMQAVCRLQLGNYQTCAV
jgi:hypothetical protein